MIFLFGDTIGATTGKFPEGRPYFPNWTSLSNDYLFRAGDPIASSSIQRPDQGLLINYFPSTTASTLPLLVQPVYPPTSTFSQCVPGSTMAMGGDDVPNAGISLHVQMYIVVNTNADTAHRNGGRVFREYWRREVLAKQEPSSIRSANSHLRCYILPFLGKVKLHELSVETQQGFVTRVGNKVSRKTTLNVMATLSSLVSTADNWGFTTEAIQIKKLALPKRGMKYEAHCFTADDLRRILAAASNPWRVLYCILTMEGLRAGEALGLQWQDIDLNRRLLNIRRSAWCGKIKTAKNESSETELPSLSRLPRFCGNIARNGNPTLLDSSSPHATVVRRHRTK